MKRLFLFGLLALMTLPILAQEIPPIVDFMDVLTNLGTYLGTFPGLVVLITFIAAIVLRFLKSVEGKVMKFVITLVLSFIAVSACNIANYGYLADVTWLVAILNGVGVAICSSMLFGVAIMKQILEWIEGQVKKE